MQDHGLTRYRKQLLLAFVARGAEWLDRHAPDGWAEYLLGFFGRITMSDGASCIVGTLVRDDFMNGLGEVAGGDKFSAFIDKHSLPQSGAWHGFNLPFGAQEDSELRDGLDDAPSAPQWTVLMEAWEHEILMRVTPEGVAACIGRMEGQLLIEPEGIEQLRENVRVAEEAETEAENAKEDAEQERDDANQAVEDAQEAAEEAESAFTKADEKYEEAVEEANDARNELEAVEGRRDRLRVAIERLAQYQRERAMLPALAPYAGETPLEDFKF